MVKYPNGNKETFHVEKETLTKSNDLAFSRRGMTLEEEINESNEYYLVIDKAVIHKKPTPIQIVSVDYPKRSRAVIKEAYFRQASTTDYNGVYRGYYVDFEAKETKNKLSFPLKNFHEHQIVHFEKCLRQDGICFVIIKFSTLNRYFITPASLIIDSFKLVDDRKSIKLVDIVSASIEISSGYRPTLAYLDAVDKIIQMKEAKTDND